MAHFMIVLIPDEAVSLEYILMIKKGVLDFAEDGIEVGIDVIVDLVFYIVEGMVDLVNGVLTLLLDLVGHLVHLHQLQQLFLLQQQLLVPPMALLHTV